MRGMMNQSVAWVIAAMSSTVIVGGGFYGMGKFGAHRGGGDSSHDSGHGEAHSDDHSAPAAEHHRDAHAVSEAHGEDHHADIHAKSDQSGEGDGKAAAHANESDHHAEEKAAHQGTERAHGNDSHEHAPSKDSGHDQIEKHDTQKGDAHHSEGKHGAPADAHHENDGEHHDEKEHKKEGAAIDHHGEEASHANVAWSYSGENGQTHWSTLSPQYAKCESGTAQSPIDFKSVTPSGSAASIQFVYHDSEVEWLNDGRGLRAKVNEGNYVKVGSKRLNLAEIRFRTPSEHTDHGQAFAGELQFVHHDVRGNTAVIGVFVKAGDENDVLMDLLLKVPEAGKAPKKVTDLRLERIFPSSQDYYSYEGSLTEPPCTEGVAWMVMRNPIEVSAKQLERMTAAIKEPNARMVQAAHGRKPKVVGMEAVAH